MTTLPELMEMARKASTEELVTLLKTYGHTSARDGGKAIDFILDGVEKSKPAGVKSQKRELVSDYLSKRGAFAEPQKVPQDLAKEFRAAQARDRQDIDALRLGLAAVVDARRSDRETLVQALADLQIVSDDRRRSRQDIAVLFDDAQDDRKVVQKLLDAAQDNGETVQELVETVKGILETVKEDRAVITGLKAKVETLSKEVQAFNDAAAAEKAEKARQLEAQEKKGKNAIMNFKGL